MLNPQKYFNDLSQHFILLLYVEVHFVVFVSI